MDNIILGYLMIHGMSAYDLKTSIRKNLSAMCSASSGSIYAALNKLLASGYVGVECMEDARDKKVYFITKEGQAKFMSWLKTPMNSEKSKNIELAKLFFGGILAKKEQIDLLDEYVRKLQEELLSLHAIMKLQSGLSQNDLAGMYQFLLQDSYNENGIKSLDDVKMTKEMIENIYCNQMMTLDYGISAINFQIQWYEKWRKRLEEE